jgi:ATPase subunit of ABC transporter with duplicated ATPase domains
MTSQDELDTTRAAVARLENDVDTLDTQISFFADLRAVKIKSLDLARAVLASATAQAQRLEREPQDARELQDALENLRRRIASAPARSHTAAQAQRLIARLEKPNCTLSTAEKLADVRATLRTFRDGLTYSDPIHHHPGDRHRDE